MFSCCSMTWQIYMTSNKRTVNVSGTEIMYFHFFIAESQEQLRNICPLQAAQTIHGRSFWSIQIPQHSGASEFRTVTDLVTISKVTNIWKHFVQGGEGIPWHIPSRLFKSRGPMAFPCKGSPCPFYSYLVSKSYELKESKHRSDEQQAPSWSTIYKQIAWVLFSI